MKAFRSLVAAALISVSLSAAAFAEPEFSVNGGAVWFSENVSAEMIQQAKDKLAAEKTPIEECSLRLDHVNQEAFAAIVKAFSDFRVVSIWCPDVTDLPPLSAMSNLASLTIESAGSVKNLDFVAPMSHLAFLAIFGLPADLKSFEPLAGKESLEVLTIAMGEDLPEGAVLPDLTPLASCPSLSQLCLQNCDGDLAPLASCQALQSLDLEGSKFKDLSALAGCSSLIKISACKMPSLDTTTLGKIPSLQFIEVGRAGNITDLNWLAGLTNLKGFTLSEEKIADFSPLAAKPDLTMLSLHSVNIPDSSFLAQLKNLSSLELSDINAQSEPFDLAPLAGLDKLSSISLSSLKVKNADVLLKLPALSVLFRSEADGVSDDLVNQLKEKGVESF